jgi:hypothetical protein
MSHPYRKHPVQATVRARRKVPWKLTGIFSLAAVVMFGIGYLIAVRVLFPPPPEPENGIAVPSMIGMTVDQAHNALRAVSLRLTEVTEIEHPSVPAGLVIAQSPLAGQQLRELAPVRIAISAGPGRVDVVLPPVAPDSIATAEEPVSEPAADSIPAPAPDTAADSVSFNR